MMKLKTLLIAVMSLVATTMSAQETATKTAYAVYCAGSEAENDPATLYFLAADAEPTGMHNGQTIRNVWSGTAVTATGRYFPAWINLTDLKANLKRVVFEESFKDVKPMSCSYWFYNCKNLATIEGIANLNTGSVENMANMFYGCSALTSLDLSSFNTGSVTDMEYMFSNCKALKALNLSNFNTAAVMKMSSMFDSCSALTSLDLSSFNTGSVTNMTYMFYGCSALTSLNLSSFTAANVKNMTYMFFGCSALTSLDLRKADKAVDMVKTGTFAKRGMAIYFPADADVSDAVFEENFVIKPAANSTSFARTFTSGNTSTLSLPFAVNTADVTAGTFYEFKGRSDDGKTVKFAKLASGSTTADKAYIFKPSTGDKVTFTGAAIERLPEMTEGDADGLYGVYTKKEFMPEEADRNIYYGWASGKFVSIGAGATLNPGRAYLKLSQTSGAKNILNAVFDDETTGISEVNTSADDNAPAYDLMGRRVNDSYRGVVIKNGKKMVR